MPKEKKEISSVDDLKGVDKRGFISFQQVEEILGKEAAEKLEEEGQPVRIEVV